MTVALTGYFFEKTVANLTTGANPATTAAPGDTLRYTLRLQTTDQALSNFRIFDELDALNAPAGFRAGHAHARHGPGRRRHQQHQRHRRHQGHRRPRHPQPEPAGQQPRSSIQFDITLAPAIANGTVVTNQSQLRLGDGTVSR